VKYFHELTKDEFAQLKEAGTTWGELAKKHPQPPWCNYPDAVRGEMGCWSLIDFRITDQESCGHCDCVKGQMKCHHCDNVATTKCRNCEQPLCDDHAVNVIWCGNACRIAHGYYQELLEANRELEQVRGKLVHVAQRLLDKLNHATVTDAHALAEHRVRLTRAVDTPVSLPFLQHAIFDAHNWLIEQAKLYYKE